MGGLADVLVGRDAELGVLDSLVSRAVAGAGGVVLLCGEPGSARRGSPATGKSTSMDVHHWWRFRDGKVCYYRGTEDTVQTQNLLHQD